MGSVRQTAGRTLVLERSSKGNRTRTILCYVIVRFAVDQRIDVLFRVAEKVEGRAEGSRLQPFAFAPLVGRRIQDDDAHARGALDGKDAVELQPVTLIDRACQLYGGQCGSMSFLVSERRSRGFAANSTPMAAEGRRPAPRRSAVPWPRAQMGADAVGSALWKRDRSGKRYARRSPRLNVKAPDARQFRRYPTLSFPAPVNCRRSTPACPPRAYLSATARSALGLVRAIVRSVRAAPLGCLRPCSQPCRVRTDTPSSAAN